MIKYFVLGVLTVYIILPVVDSILAIVLSLLEVIKGSLALKVAKINQQITTLDEPEEETRNSIGFIQQVDKEVDKEAEEYDIEA